MDEQEIVTIALGNYSCLTAAQWVNGTTKFDLERKTIFHEVRSTVAAAASSAAASGVALTGGESRAVPRLVMLDNYHGSRIAKEIPLDAAATEEFQFDPENLNDGDDDDGVMELDDFSYMDPTRFMSAAAEDDESDSEGEELQARHGVSRSTGRTEAAIRRHRDPEQQQRNGADDDSDDEDDGGKKALRLSQQDERLAKRDRHNAKAVFDVRDRFIPWHQYVQTGLHSRSYHVLRDLHSETRGASLLHSVGFGMHAFGFDSAREDGPLHRILDSTRFMLEACDQPQGVQCFVDGDSCFGGASAQLLKELEVECGHKFSRLVGALYEPFPTQDMVHDAFARVREDEVVLNRALSLYLLSETSTGLVPFMVDQWAEMHSPLRPPPQHRVSCDEPTNTAQLVATTWDSALYGLRVGAGPQDNSPEWRMWDLERVIRPSSGLSIASAYAAVPLRLTGLPQQHRQVQQQRSHDGAHDDGTEQQSFWAALQRNALLDCERGPVTTEDDGASANGVGASFLPLTHAVAHSPLCSSGTVLGHTFTLRGIKSLLDRQYPREEAVLRYAMPLRSATFHATISKEEYPVSDTFPSRLVLPDDAAKASTTLAELGVASLPVGAHLVCSYGAAPMLQRIVDSYDKVWKYRRHLHHESFPLETDEWKEASEGLHQLHDNYRHEDDPRDDSD